MTDKRFLKIMNTWLEEDFTDVSDMASVVLSGRQLQELIEHAERIKR